MNPRRAEVVVYTIIAALLATALVLLVKRYWGIASVLLTTAGAIVDQVL